MSQCESEPQPIPLSQVEAAPSKVETAPSKVETAFGVGLLLAAGFGVARTVSITRYLLSNYKNLHKSSLDVQSLMRAPHREEHLILDNLRCAASPELFREHMTYIDRDAINSTKEFCFKSPAANFAAEITLRNEKHEVYCDCSTFDPFVSTPLLVNNYDLIKKPGNKHKLTMISYGCIRYDRHHKRLNFEGHCFATSLDQIEWVWGKILLHKTALYFGGGIALGIALSLLYENYKRWREE